MKEQKPRYRGNCPDCRFLGWSDNRDPKDHHIYDLYICFSKIHKDFLINIVGDTYFIGISKNQIYCVSSPYNRYTFTSQCHVLALEQGLYTPDLKPMLIGKRKHAT